MSVPTPASLDVQISTLQTQINEQNHESALYRKIIHEIDLELVKYAAELQSTQNQSTQLLNGIDALRKHTRLLVGNNATTETLLAKSKEKIAGYRREIEMYSRMGTEAREKLEHEKLSNETLAQMKRETLRERNDLLKKQEKLSMETRRIGRMLENAEAREEIQRMKQEGY